MQFKVSNIKHFISILLLVLFTSLSWAQTEIELDDRQNYIDKIIEHFGAGNWEAGKAVIDDVKPKHPNDSDLRMLSGKYEHHVGNNSKARFELVKSLQINPNNVDAKQILVNVELEEKRYSSAICYVNELLEVNPYWRGLWRKKIQLYRLQGNQVEANRLQNRINQVYPEDSILRQDYLYNMKMEAIEKRKDGNIEEVIEIREKMLKEDPNDPENYLSLANDHIKAGDLYSALSYIDRGLIRFPENPDLINRKAGILAEKKKYDELLPFLEKKGYMQKYNYYLLEAARYSRNQEASTLHGKVFENNPSNAESFSVIYNHSISVQQYPEALRLIEKHRAATGNSKDLLVKELQVYTLMKNQSKINAITKELFDKYPNDIDIQSRYTLILLDEAKLKMQEQRYAEAIEDWYQIIKYGDADIIRVAERNIYVAHLEQEEYYKALNILNEMIAKSPENLDLYAKRGELYYRQNNFHMSLLAYETAIEKASGLEKRKYIGGYSDLATKIVQTLIENYQYNEAVRYLERWLEQAPDNVLALKYATNLSMEMEEYEKAMTYAQQGNQYYPDHVFFIIKIAELRAKDEANIGDVYYYLSDELEKNSYNRDLVNAHAQITSQYSLKLIKIGMSIEAIEMLNDAIKDSPDNNTLKYTKGLAYEKIKNYDSAYYYQSFYIPAPQEETEFQNYLHYLYSKSLKNEVGLNHLRSRPAEIDYISVISTASYSRFAGKNTFTGRANYTGRNTGKGIQLQGEWMRDWNLKTYTLINAAISNKFFPKLAINASFFRYLPDFSDITLELGLGYRYIDTEGTNAKLQDANMFNLVLGATKNFGDFRVNAKLNNFFLDGNYLFNFTANARYQLWSPRHYITAMAGVGTSPDIKLLDYQLYNGFSKLNTMVGAGFSYLFTKNVSGGILTNWYNYKSSKEGYRNIHNIYLNLNVTF